MFQNNRVCKLLGIKYPIIQAGMVWVSGAKLAAASSNAGALGVIGAGSMKPELLAKHIIKAKSLLNNKNSPLAVNVPLLYRLAEEQIQTAIDHGIKIIITAAGSPKKYTQMLKDKGVVVMHVTSSPELALKCEQAGVDAIIAEGFEAGGHNGRDEITTMCLIPQVADAVTIPVIAAGGIADGRGIVASLSLGADAVQMGTRFVMTEESSAHDNYKQAIRAAKSGDTSLMLKKLVPVRLLSNDFSKKVAGLEDQCATSDQLSELLGKGRAKSGMLDGDMSEGELEIGQISAMIKSVPTVQSLMTSLLKEIDEVIKKNF